MEETREQQKLHGFLQCAIYVSILLEVSIFVYLNAPFWSIFFSPLAKLAGIFIYQKLVYSKLTTFGLICLVSIGTLAKKETELDPKSISFTRFAPGCCCSLVVSPFRGVPHRLPLLTLRGLTLHI